MYDYCEFVVLVLATQTLIVLAMCDTRRNPLWHKGHMQRISWTVCRACSGADIVASASGRSVGSLVMRLVDGLTVVVFVVMGVVCLWEVMP
jgi:hypothetical protein